jgi:tyrosyl-tRNA synthetase
MAKAGWVKSKSQARQLIEQGGVTVNDEKVGAVDFALSESHAHNGQIQIRVGKKRFYRLVTPA